jgi:hypothetical protein
MKKPYLEKLGTYDGFDVWYVDGSWIRKNLQREFTNYGANYIYEFIPEKEFWIDLEFGDVKEWKYYLKFLLTRYKFVSKGKSDDESIEIAEIAEKRERDKSETIQEIRKLSKKQMLERIHKNLLEEYSKDKLKVWIVDGFIVRCLFFTDFTEGGHEFVYKFVPEGEVWIDNALNPEEIKFVLIHEFHEMELMKKGWSYEKAHKDSSKIEFFCRNNPDKADEILKQEFEKQLKA